MQSFSLARCAASDSDSPATGVPEGRGGGAGAAEAEAADVEARESKAESCEVSWFGEPIGVTVTIFDFCSIGLLPIGCCGKYDLHLYSIGTF